MASAFVKKKFIAFLQANKNKSFNIHASTCPLGSYVDAELGGKYCVGWGFYRRKGDTTFYHYIYPSWALRFLHNLKDRGGMHVTGKEALDLLKIV